MVKIALVANTSWYLLNFRLNLMKLLAQEGYDVYAIADYDKVRLDIFLKYHIKPIPIKIDPVSLNPIKEFFTVLALIYQLWRHKIDFVFSYTPKGNIYSAVSSRLLSIPYVPNISGQGMVSVQGGLLHRVVNQLYKFSLRNSKFVFFQNNEDMNFFIENKLVSDNKCLRLPGSGVDLNKFLPHPLVNRPENALNFLLVARLLWDKGVGVYADAARIIKAKYPHCTFQLLGFIDERNSSGINAKDLELWQAEGIVEYLGSTDDVYPYLVNADCIVLPSFYGEGVPRSLLEASATMRPIITTDTPGCRDVVKDRISGFLCKIKDPYDLASKIEIFLSLTFSQRISMGIEARNHMEINFDENIVLGSYLRILKNHFL